MTVLDAEPLCEPVNKAKLRLLGNLLIICPIVCCLAFLVSVWLSPLVPSANIYDSEAHWYYQCLVPAVMPATVFFAYWIWLSSQYFRSHREPI